MNDRGLTELIAKLEAASGPDRELDGEVWKVAAPEAWERTCSFRGQKYAGHVYTRAKKDVHIKRMAAHHSPAYTASIDAALTVVPDGWRYVALVNKEEYPQPFGVTLSEDHRDDLCRLEAAIHTTSLPIAICIAALKARAALARETP